MNICYCDVRPPGNLHVLGFRLGLYNMLSLGSMVSSLLLAEHCVSVSSLGDLKICLSSLIFNVCLEFRAHRMTSWKRQRDT